LLITVESLDRIFERHNTTNIINYKGKCHNCGCDVEVEITKTSGGCGLQGGVLYGSNPENLIFQCCDYEIGDGNCYDKIIL
jgi:hypothetical protein